jgi:hypothetical protein
MRLKDLVMELDLNPGNAFSKGFKAGGDTVDKILSPSKWGQGPGPAGTKEPGAAKSLQLDPYQVKDAQVIIDAVIKGNVSALSKQQIDTARAILGQLNKL